MQPACSLHYASSVAASIEIHVHNPGVDPGMQGVDALHPGVDALHARVDALHFGVDPAEMQGIDAEKIRRE